MALNLGFTYVFIWENSSICPKCRTWNPGVTSLPKDTVLRVFISAGCESSNRGSKGEQTQRECCECLYGYLKCNVSRIYLTVKYVKENVCLFYVRRMHAARKVEHY
jgi:hypothetical protein